MLRIYTLDTHNRRRLTVEGAVVASGDAEFKTACEAARRGLRAANSLSR